MDRMTLDGKPLDPGVCGRALDTATFEPDPWVPLSARGSRRAMLKWRAKGFRERVALRIAPWLEPFD